MKVDREYLIPFVGLKEGLHQYDFKVGTKFFETFECFDYTSVDAKIGLELEKQSTMMVLNFDVSGAIVSACDRCTDDVSVPITGNYRVIARFTEEDYEETEEIINLPPSEYELDVSGFIYEFIRLSIPSKIVHEEGECNLEMLKQLEKYTVSEEPEQTEEVDPRWAALNKLKKSN